MNRTEKRLVCANGNDGQLPQLRAFYQSLRAPDKGNYQDDICVISTALSPSVQRTLQDDGILFHIDPLEHLFSLPLARKVGLFEYIQVQIKNAFEKAREAQTPDSSIDELRLQEIASISLFKAALEQGFDDAIWESKGKGLFATYRNKHFSKFGLLSFLGSLKTGYDKILLCDGDMVFQTPVDALFEQVTDDRICVGDEVNSILPGTAIYRSNRIAALRHPQLADQLALGERAHELNVGVLLGKADRIEALVKDWGELMFYSGLDDLFYAHPTDFWHEQDFMRLLRDREPSRFKNLPRESLMHLSSLGHEIVSETEGAFRLRSNGKLPTIVHFAGATWKKYKSMRERYLPPADSPPVS